MNWYIVQAYSGFEKKVVEAIKDELKKHELSEKLGEILVPTHQVTEVKKGKRIKKEKKYFPGYVLLKIELTKQIFHMIKNLQKVSGFLGSSSIPRRFFSSSAIFFFWKSGIWASKSISSMFFTSFFFFFSMTLPN